ncbi:hypothetical protein F4803DRAFT_313788 [Xylaria telfairii]|nr:hypothetical protein F4803DRAFT_313788 [Xylaria telfairii]
MISGGRQLREVFCLFILHTGGSTNPLAPIGCDGGPIGDLECPDSLKTCRRDASCMIDACLPASLPASLPACLPPCCCSQNGRKGLTQSFKRTNIRGAWRQASDTQTEPKERLSANAASARNHALRRLSNYLRNICKITPLSVYSETG